MRLSQGMIIKAPIETVWALVQDVERWPSFLPTMSRIEIEGGGELELGSRVHIKQPLQPVHVWTVLSMEEPALFRWRTGRGWIALIATHLLEPCQEGTKQTLILELEGRFALPIAIFGGWLLQLALWYENTCFRKRAERLAGAEP